MSIFSMKKFHLDSLDARIEYFEWPTLFGLSTDTLVSIYAGIGHALLGLNATPAQGGYGALTRGMSPVDGKPLVGEHRLKCLESSRTVIGFSTSLNLHKSLSILYAGLPAEDQKQFERALVRAILKTVLSLELNDTIGARIGRGGAKFVQASAVALCYVHCTNRALEPHLHVHVELPNLCRCPDGQWRTLDSTRLYSRQLQIALTFDEHLMKALCEFLPWLSGQLWSDDRGIYIPTIPAEIQIEASSRRKGVLEALGSGAQSAVAATYSTRESKKDMDLAGLLAGWREEFSSLVQGLRG